MTTKTVYQTDHLGILVGITVADQSPLEPGVWIIPGGCVEPAPPQAAEHQLPRWDGERWHLIDSYKGLTVYNTQTGEASTIERHGALPDGFTLLEPGPHQVWEKGQWVDDIPAIVDRTYEEKRTAINAACEQTIVGGFWAEALGERHFYASALEDQLNLTGVITWGQSAPFACIDESGNKEFKLHSPEQLLQVGNTFCEFKLEALQRADRLKKLLTVARAAKDIDAINALSWETPLP